MLHLFNLSPDCNHVLCETLDVQLLLIFGIFEKQTTSVVFGKHFSNLRTLLLKVLRILIGIWCRKKLYLEHLIKCNFFMFLVIDNFSPDILNHFSYLSGEEIFNICCLMIFEYEEQGRYLL